MRLIANALGFLLTTGCCTTVYAQLAANISVETTNQPDGRTRYDYHVENLPESTNPIDIILLDIAADADPQSITQPLGWFSDFVASEISFRFIWASASSQFDIPVGGSGDFSIISPLEPDDVRYVMADAVPDFSEFIADMAGFVAGPLVPPAGGLNGDYDDSGEVDQADLDLVLLNWGNPPRTLPASWTNMRPTEGIVDQEELDGVLLNWGNVAALGAAASVPEPSTWVLVAACALFMATCRMR